MLESTIKAGLALTSLHLKVGQTSLVEMDAKCLVTYVLFLEQSEHGSPKLLPFSGPSLKMTSYLMTIPEEEP